MAWSRTRKHAARRRARYVRPWFAAELAELEKGPVAEDGDWAEAYGRAIFLAYRGCVRGNYLAAVQLDAVDLDDDADRWARRSASAGDPDGLRRWAMALNHRKKSRPAMRAMERASHINPDAFWDARLVDWRFWAGDITVTVEDLQRAAQIDPSVRLGLGAKLRSLGRVDEAERELEIAEADGFREAWIPLASIARERGDAEKQLYWNARGAVQGDAECTFNEALERWDRGEEAEALRLFKEAAWADRWARQWLSSRQRERRRARRAKGRVSA